jgi:hypothetical protein
LLDDLIRKAERPALVEKNGNGKKRGNGKKNGTR